MERIIVSADFQATAAAIPCVEVPTRLNSAASTPALPDAAPPAPAAGLALSHRPRAGQHHGSFAGALGDDPSSSLYHDRGVPRPDLDKRAGADGQRVPGET